MAERFHHPEPGQKQYDISVQWKHVFTERDGLTSTGEFCTPRPYISLQVPSDKLDKRYILRRVLFTTYSRDQGFASHHQELNGRYFDSQTYFEVWVLDQNDQDRIPREILIHNRRATAEWTKHIVCWDYRDETLYDAQKHYPPITNRGVVPCRWVDQIRAGDTIQIIPRAEWPGWTNYIGGARIDIWVEVVEISPLVETKRSNSINTMYRPLDTGSKEIRLVIIEPRKDHPESDTPYLNTQYTSLLDSNRTRYEALSYCWGDDNNKSEIRLTDQEGTDFAEIKISSNLYHALKRLRRYDVPRIFWIDLLCINQKDVEERGNQVALMGEIYSAAESVSVWLGELEENIHTEKDLEILSKIARTHDPVLSGDPADRKALKPCDTHHGFFNNGRYNHNGLFPDRIFLRHWFQRIWVLQEVWNASSALSTADGSRRHAVTVICGKFELPWWVVVQANACMASKNRQRRGNAMPVIWADLFQDAGPKHNHQLIGQPGPRLDILTVLIHGLDAKATEPRDRIFALLVFGKETSDLAKLPDLIRPNYAKSTAQVYADFVIWWIQEHGSLRIISAVHTLHNRTWVDLSGKSHSNTSKNTPDRPSWTLWSNGDSGWARGTLALQDSHNYRACGDNALDIPLLTSPLPPSVESHHPLWAVPSFKGIRISYIASLDYFPVSPTPSSSSPDLLVAYIKLFDPKGHQWIWRDSPYGASPSQPSESLQNIEAHVSAHHVELRDKDRKYFPCHGKPFFKTQDGQVGLCPSGTRVGDVVTIFHGGLVPYLIRPWDEAGLFTFVGECFVDGFMKGEAFHKQRDDKYREEVFRLI